MSILIIIATGKRTGSVPVYPPPPVYVDQKLKINIETVMIESLQGGICTYAQCAKGDMAENKNDICVMGDIRGLKKGFQELQGRKTVKLDCETFHVEEKEMNKKNARKECEMLENEASKENPDPIKVAEWEQFQQGGKEVEKTQPVKIWCEGKTCSRTTCRKYLCRCMDKFNSPGSCCSYFQEWGIATKS